MGPKKLRRERSHEEYDKGEGQYNKQKESSWLTILKEIERLKKYVSYAHNKFE